MFTALTVGFIIMIFGIILIIKKGEVVIPKGINYYLLLFIALSYLFVILIAIDKGLAFLGFLKILVVPAFLFLLFQSNYKENKTIYYGTIPLSASIMTILSGVVFFIPRLSSFFYGSGKRLGGFFQYPNTFALFLLLGIIIILFKEKIKVSDYIMMLILLIGIFITGSRTIFILLLFALVFCFIKNKSARRLILSGASALIAIIIFAVIFQKGFASIGRILSISAESSTFLGRLLYDIDGLKIIFNKPLGLGYLGYNYVQGSFQTGLYSVRFIHNEFLQLALDAGILPLIAFLIIIIKSLISKNVLLLEKAIILTCCLHFAFDFDLQYTIIFILFVTALDFGKTVSVKLKKKFALSVLCSVFALAFLYFAFADFFYYIDKPQISLKMYRYNTEVLENVLLKAKTPEESEKQADFILKYNRFSVTALDAKASVCQHKNNFDGMVNFKKLAIKNSRYNIKSYEDYVFLLKAAIEYSKKKQNNFNVKKYTDLVLEVPNELEKLRKETNSLSYKLSQKPSFTLAKSASEYITKLKAFL